MTAFYLSAAHKSSGKTTVSIGICAALCERGLKVQPFKKGPDYIDPIWLEMASGQPCYNLDFYIAGREATCDAFHLKRQGADIAVIEGNKGLHDGLDLDGSNSNAALATAIDCPVIMVVDARGTMRGIAPLLIGYQQFDPKVKIAGVIANMTGGSRHESKLREAVEYYTDILFLGALDKQDELALDERHIGLIPGYEDPRAKQRIETIRNAVKDNIDLDYLVGLPGLPEPARPGHLTTQLPRFEGLRIGIVRDAAFGFYYPDDLEAFSGSGAELIEIDTLQDSDFPDIDGLFIGGGFPERHAARLSGNQSMRDAIKQAIENGLPTYAECGGLMYLSRGIRWHDEYHEMVGIIDATSQMHERPCGRGYVQLEEVSGAGFWPNSQTGVIDAHEFHYSSLEELEGRQRYQFQVKRGNGIKHLHDGLIQHNLMATYAHQRHTRRNPWVTRFLGFVSRVKGGHCASEQLKMAK